MQYLLERLATANQRTAGVPLRSDLRGAVRRQLERVVGSHFWPGAPGLELMGMSMPPISTAGYACATDVERYCAALGDAVLRHEPRLQVARIALEQTGSPLAPWQLVITGRLDGAGDAEERFRFDLPGRA